MKWTARERPKIDRIAGETGAVVRHIPGEPIGNLEIKAMAVPGSVLMLLLALSTVAVAAETAKGAPAGAVQATEQAVEPATTVQKKAAKPETRKGKRKDKGAAGKKPEARPPAADEPDVVKRWRESDI